MDTNSKPRSTQAVTFPGQATDASVIAASCHQPEAFSAVFDRHFSSIHGYVARRLGVGLADDIAADTFLVAFNQRERYDVTQPDAGPWLYGIASNLIARHKRSESRGYRALARRGVEREAQAGGEDSDNRLDALNHRHLLASALADLPDRDRDVLLLVAWADLSCEEAARALGIPAGTARSRLHRARRKLRPLIESTSPPEEVFEG